MNRQRKQAWRVSSNTPKWQSWDGAKVSLTREPMTIMITLNLIDSGLYCWMVMLVRETSVVCEHKVTQWQEPLELSPKRRSICINKHFQKNHSFISHFSCISSAFFCFITSQDFSCSFVMKVYILKYLLYFIQYFWMFWSWRVFILSIRLSQIKCPFFVSPKQFNIIDAYGAL